MPIDQSSTLDVESPVAVTMSESGAAFRSEIESRL
jgi:hypothetical protein